jgi:ElaB/YqjD/DUF883 family membrane-anchored ribosome-binding protein
MPDELNNPVINPQVNLQGVTDGPSQGGGLEGAQSHLRDAAGSLRSNFDSTKDHVRQAAEELRSAAEAKARDFRSAAENKANELRDRAEHAYGEARERARTFQEDGEQYVRENPTRAVLTAVAAGFVLGLIIRR